MLEFAGLNYWAVIVTWLMYLAVGAFWYSPAGFSKQWAKHTGIDIMKLPKEQANKILMAVSTSSLMQVLVLAIIIQSLNIQNATDGLVTGVVLWLGLTAATSVGVSLYQKRSWKFVWLNSSYFLLVMSAGSVILAVWS